MSFELTSQATLESLDIRKEGPAENKHLMLDLKLWVRTNADLLAHFHPTLKHFLFTDEGSPRIATLKPIALEGRMRNMELEIGGHCFMGVELGKFKFEPMDGFAVGLSFAAKLSPDGSQTAQLAEFVGDELAIDIRPQPELDLAPRETHVNIVATAPAHRIPAAIDGKQPNEAGVYFPTETLSWGTPKKNHVSIDLVELDTGEWLSACAIRIGTTYSSGPLKAWHGNYYASRDDALKPIQSKLTDLYAKGLDSGLSKTEFEQFSAWVNSSFTALPTATKRHGEKPVIKFRHPDNDQLSWTGRGKPPAWAKALMDSGRQLEAV
jgi:hypothetical protein